MTDTLCMDHIVVSAETLHVGVEYVQDTLGVQVAPGGKHPAMGTHNALMGLGEFYLEVIAIDPDAPNPQRNRWFDLDNFKGAPRLTNWVARSNNLAALVEVGPPNWGTLTDLSRDDLTWTVTIDESGTLPFGGAFPGGIDWGNTAHPSTRLADVGCRLRNWSITCPQADALKDAFNKLPGQFAAQVKDGPFGLVAEIETPHGLRVLS